MSTLEENILKPVDPAIRDSDDWPTFELSDVFIYKDNPQTPVSLLAADGDSPVIVEGRLESVERDQAAHLVRKRSLPKELKIINVKKFAYGQYDNGQLGLWAAGKAGWFEVHPSEEYAPTFDEMIEAIRVLYFLEDEYRSMTRKRARKESKGALRIGLQRYALAAGLGGASEDDIAEIFYKHRNFLFATILKKPGKPPNWALSPVIRHLKKEFPEDYALAQEKLDRAVSTSSEGSEAEEEEESSQSVEVYDAPAGHVATDDEDGKADAIIEAMRQLKAHSNLGFRQITIDRLVKALCETEVENTDQARALIYTHRIPLIEKLKRTPPGNWWAQSQVYKHLVATSTQTRAPSRPISNKRSKQQASAMSDSKRPIVIESDSDEAELTPASRKGRKGKSVLRPRSAKYANKAAGRRGRAPQPNQEEVEPEDIDLESSNSPSIRLMQNGPTPVLRNQLFNQLFDESDDDDSGDPEDKTLPVQWKHPDGIVEQPSLKFIEEPLPSMRAQGPGDSWMCVFDGCTHIVYGASTTQGKQKIRMHFHTHTGDPEQLIDLVNKEQRPYLPVHNLINRLRAMADEQSADALQASANGSSSLSFPKPIRRKY